MVTANARSLLLGRNKKRARQWSIGVGMLFVASLLYFAAVKAVDYPTIHLALWWEGYAVLLTVLVAVQAYSNGGLVVSWLLTFAAVVGLVLNYGGIGLTGGGPGIVELIGLATVGGVIAAAIVGTLGFGIGTAVRRTAK
ncbi:hypothetical protein ACFQE1_09590 [Halobium palmae]|uniref:SPW repeat-containing protein n=1 Tax=Halobium palmae TaxID=1776492 RepID=A0ABD5S019_9EURY